MTNGQDILDQSLHAVVTCPVFQARSSRKAVAAQSPHQSWASRALYKPVYSATNHGFRACAFGCIRPSTVRLKLWTEPCTCNFMYIPLFTAYPFAWHGCRGDGWGLLTGQPTCKPLTTPPIMFLAAAYHETTSTYSQRAVTTACKLADSLPWRRDIRPSGCIGVCISKAENDSNFQYRLAAHASPLHLQDNR